MIDGVFTLYHTFPGRSVVGTEKHGEFTADAVIVTVSLGVLKAEVIEFTPPLPVEKRRLINEVGVYEQIPTSNRLSRVLFPAKS